jgi:hypothetical protein
MRGRSESKRKGLQEVAVAMDSSRIMDEEDRGEGNGKVGEEEGLGAGSDSNFEDTGRSDFTIIGAIGHKKLYGGREAEQDIRGGTLDRHCSGIALRPEDCCYRTVTRLNRSIDSNRNCVRELGEILGFTLILDWGRKIKRLGYFELGSLDSPQVIERQTDILTKCHPHSKLKTYIEMIQTR